MQLKRVNISGSLFPGAESVHLEVVAVWADRDGEEHEVKLYNGYIQLQLNEFLEPSELEEKVEIARRSKRIYDAIEKTVLRLQEQIGHEKEVQSM